MCQERLTKQIHPMCIVSSINLSIRKKKKKIGKKTEKVISYIIRNIERTKKKRTTMILLVV